MVFFTTRSFQRFQIPCLCFGILAKTNERESMAVASIGARGQFAPPKQNPIFVLVLFRIYAMISVILYIFLFNHEAMIKLLTIRFAPTPFLQQVVDELLCLFWETRNTENTLSERQMQKTVPTFCATSWTVSVTTLSALLAK